MCRHVFKKALYLYVAVHKNESTVDVACRSVCGFQGDADFTLNTCISMTVTMCIYLNACPHS